MKPSLTHAFFALVLLSVACADPAATTPDSADGATGNADGQADAGATADGSGAPDAHVPCVDTPKQCALAAEQRAAERLVAVLENAAALDAFLAAVPKGGDLHLHLSGSVYAETYMEWAREDGGFCIKTYNLALSKSCDNSSNSAPVPEPGDPLFDEVIGAWSMEGFVPGKETGKEHFFAAFGKFGAISGSAYHARSLADVMKRADSENMLYLEPMLHSNYIAKEEGSKVWTGGGLFEKDFEKFHKALLADAQWYQSTDAIINDIKNTEAGARKELGCDGPTPHSACRVGVRYMVYISRSGSGPKVFAQMVAAFEAAMVEPRLVGLNLVGPEDSKGALKPYDRQMAMLGYLHEAYAGKSPLLISLHAGELVSEYLPSGYTIDGIDHIRKAVEIAHARRIGHGVDVLKESDPDSLMATMKELGVMVEIGLSSNIQILEVSGAAHPLWAYIGKGVPVALATDDQGISRSSMAGEYRRAVLDQELDYRTLKRMARTSLDKSFLPGGSLWLALDPPQAVTACEPAATATYGDASVPQPCQTYLDSSDKAAMQWALEQRFAVFEAAQP